MAKDSMAKASTPEPFSASKTSNWVARGGGLPDYIQHIAHDLVEKRGKTESEAIAMAIGIVKRWARGGGNVDAGTRAAAAKAVAEWEALKAKNAVKGAGKAVAKAAVKEGEAELPSDAAMTLASSYSNDDLATFIPSRVGLIVEAFDGKKAPPFRKGGGRGGEKGGWTGEHKGGGGSPFGKGSGKCPTCDEPISQHDLGGRLKKDKVEESWLQESWSPQARAAAMEARRRHLHGLADVADRAGRKDLAKYLRVKKDYHPWDVDWASVEEAAKLPGGGKHKKGYLDSIPTEHVFHAAELQKAGDEADRKTGDGDSYYAELDRNLDNYGISAGIDYGPLASRRRSKAKGRVQEAALSSADREKLPDSAFVFPKDKRYPIHDLAHARNALARCSGKPEEGKVKAAVHAKYPQLKGEK